MVAVVRAEPSGVARLAGVLGRALVTEPMMSWPLGGRRDDLETRCIQTYGLYLVPLLDAGLVWETSDGRGVLVLVAPQSTEVWEDALTHVEESTTHQVTDDGGARHERFWEWVAARVPAEPCWHIDSVGIEPGWQGQGIGSALVAFAVEQARRSRSPVILETGTPRNVPLYERHGFVVIDEEDSPDGGPRIWFMRRDF